MNRLDCIWVEEKQYRPHLLPVDYGTLVVRCSLTLEDGRYLERSTLQTAGEEGPDSEAALARALHLLQEACCQAYREEGLLPAQEFLVNDR